MTKLSPLALCLAAAMALMGCADDAPEVQVLEVTPGELTLSLDAENDVTMVVRYSDGDGDLGGGVAEVTDCRAEGLVTVLSIPAIANPQAVDDEIAIDGDMLLHVNDIIEVAAGQNAHCADNGVPPLAQGELALCVTLIDSAGHRSNADCSATVRTFTEQ